MDQPVITYFDSQIMPVLRRDWAGLLPEMSIQILGSVGLGIDDARSDLEAVIYLPEPLWQRAGAGLQLAMDRCLRQHNPWQREGSILSVHPIGWALDGQGWTLLERPEDFAWDEVSIPALFTLQENLIYADPSGRLTRLRQASAPARMPEAQWRKRLLAELEDLADNILPDLAKSAARGLADEAPIHLGLAAEGLFHVSFLIARRYYPWRTHLRWAFDRLPEPAAALGARFDVLKAGADWPERAAAAQALFEDCRRIITQGGHLPGVDLYVQDLRNELIWANRCQAWENPEWRGFVAERERRAVAAGYPPELFWVWSLWGLEGPGVQKPVDSDF